MELDDNARAELKGNVARANLCLKEAKNCLRFAAREIETALGDLASVSGLSEGKVSAKLTNAKAAISKKEKTCLPLNAPL